MPRFTDRFVPPTPKYRRHRASGQAVVTLSGHDYYLGPHGTKASRIEYDRLIAEWLASGRHLIKPGTTDLSIAELSLAYLRYAKTYYVKDGQPTSTLAGIKRALDALARLYGRMSVDEFGPKRLKALRHRMVQTGKLSRTTINKRIGIIKLVFAWGVAEELVPPNHYPKLAAVKGLKKGRTEARESRPVKPVAPEIVEATMPYLSQVVANMIRFQRLTGSRPGEVCQLRPMDVDQSKSIWKYRPSSHKTEHHDRERIIFIGPKAQDVLQPYLLRPRDAYCFSPSESAKQRREVRHESRKTPMSCGNTPGSNCKPAPKRQPKNKYTKDAYNRAIQRGCEAAFCMPHELRRIPKKTPKDEKKRLQRRAAEWRAKHCWSPNQLRHAAGTDVRRQYGLEAAQCVLGHAKADVSQVYAERDQALAAKIMGEIG
jgi:integrase